MYLSFFKCYIALIKPTYFKLKASHAPSEYALQIILVDSSVQSNPARVGHQVSNPVLQASGSGAWEQTSVSKMLILSVSPCSELKWLNMTVIPFLQNSQASGSAFMYIKSKDYFS